MTFGPVQLRKHLGMSEWQFLRGRRLDLIPTPDAGRRWTDTAAAGLAARRDELVERLGTVPDCGAHLAAEHLSARLGREVPVHVIIELHRGGHLPIVGNYRGSPLYCGQAVEAFNDADALDRALIDGQLLNAGQAAAFLRIRRADFGWLLKLRLLTPVHWVQSRRQSRAAAPNVALYRVSDLEALLRDTTVDWAAVRAAPPRTRSVLARLKDGGVR